MPLGPRAARWKNGSSPRPGTHRPQCRAWRDGGIRANRTSAVSFAFSGKVDSQYWVDSASSLGHSISNHSCGCGSLRVSRGLRQAMEVNHEATRAVSSG